MDPKEEKKPETPQAPAQADPVKKEGEQKPDQEVKAGPTGLDALATDEERLKELYKRSPQMFEKVVKEAKPPEKTAEKKPDAPPDKPAQSAAPVYGGSEIKLPTDVKVNRAAVDAYLKHAEEVGLSVEQVQKQIDWQTKNAREEAARMADQASKLADQGNKTSPKEPTPEEQDVRNVKVLKEKWGEKYEENLERARQAAVKFAGTKMLEKLRTSDPDLVQHFLTLAEKDGDDKTPRAPNRSGDEEKPDVEGEEDQAQSHLKNRYKNSPTMFQRPVRD